MAVLRPQQISIVSQGEVLRKVLPSSQFTTRRGKLCWQGWVTPSPVSLSYKVQLTYRLDEQPHIQVLEPALSIPAGHVLPHVYPGDKLCLYFPDGKQWHGGKLLAYTVLPWISEWLFFYEIWLVTKQWNGGGTH